MKLSLYDLSNWNNKPKEDYQDIIANHAKDGWRLSKYLPQLLKELDFPHILKLFSKSPSIDEGLFPCSSIFTLAHQLLTICEFNNINKSSSGERRKSPIRIISYFTFALNISDN
ncbi:DUF4177 domain-containing protein [Paenibacillus radicis (ex Gao et al. 2016)]|uniref:DUF4177 domain-containing protein n=1 Tax=Paenibacillus radicis (ex Gao et al. 2016) TaxID=1737354 RepID=UPI0035B53990